MFAQAEQRNVLEAIKYWIMFMFGLSIMIWITKAMSMIFFSKVGHNITKSVRQELYQSVLRKNIGWHDERSNGTGVITATLSSDVQLLNGASSEGMAAMIEATAAFVWGLLLAFIFSWPMGLVGLAICPIMTIASFMQQKADKDMYFEGAVKEDLGVKNTVDEEKKKHKKMADLLVADVISNYKTVASFGNDHLIVDEFEFLMQGKMSLDIKNAKIFGLSWGIAQAVYNLAFASLYLAASELYYAYPEEEVLRSDNLFIAMFCILFGALAAAQAM